MINSQILHLKPDQFVQNVKIIIILNLKFKMENMLLNVLNIIQLEKHQVLLQNQLKIVLNLTHKI